MKKNRKKTDMDHSLQILEWDTDFFNYNVAKIEGTLQNQSDLERIEKLIRNSESVLTYFSSSKELPPQVTLSEELSFILVDKKTTYTKAIDSKIEFDKNISPIDEHTPQEKLKEMAIQSGAFSRFNVDKKIESNKFKELYRLWMVNSLNKKFAKEVLVYKVEGEIAGFVTLVEKNMRAAIGIIAVDKAHRGKGIGKILMKNAEKWFTENGFSTIQVVTQGDNVPACKMYESCGYVVERVEYFYHIWKNELEVTPSKSH